MGVTGRRGRRRKQLPGELHGIERVLEIERGITRSHFLERKRQRTCSKTDCDIYTYICRSQWPRGLRRRSAVAGLLRSWVRESPGAGMFVCCECCMLRGTGICDELITRPEESCRLWCVVVCDQETSSMRRPWTTMGRNATGNIYIYVCVCVCVCV